MPANTSEMAVEAIPPPRLVLLEFCRSGRIAGVGRPGEEREHERRARRTVTVREAGHAQGDQARARQTLAIRPRASAEGIDGVGKYRRGRRAHERRDRHAARFHGGKVAPLKKCHGDSGHAEGRTRQRRKRRGNGARPEARGEENPANQQPDDAEQRRGNPRGREAAGESRRSKQQRGGSNAAWSVLHGPHSSPRRARRPLARMTIIDKIRPIHSGAPICAIARSPS